MSHTTEDKFTAALAHQLKTPTAALQAASLNLRRNLRGLLEDLASMMERIESTEGGEAAAIAHFIARALNEPSSAPMTGLLPEERVSVIAARLASVGLEGDLGSTAASLLRGAWDSHLDEIAPLLRREPEPTLDILETVARLRANLGAVDAALSRIRGVASALRLLGRPSEGGVVDLEQSFATTLAMLGGTLPPGVTLATRFSAAPPVTGPAELLSEVWCNLIANAAQALAGAGHITIEIEPAGEERVAVRVIDDGPGIPAELMPGLFERFFTTRAAEGGSGLGLALSRQIVEKLGGTIQVDSRPGRTCFEVLLPCAAMHQAGV